LNGKKSGPQSEHPPKKRIPRAAKVGCRGNPVGDQGTARGTKPSGGKHSKPQASTGNTRTLGGSMGEDAEQPGNLNIVRSMYRTGLSRKLGRWKEKEKKNRNNTAPKKGPPQKRGEVQTSRVKVRR